MKHSGILDDRSHDNPHVALRQAGYTLGPWVFSFH